MPRRVLHLVSNLGPNAGGRSASLVIPQLQGIECLTINLGETHFELPTVGRPYRYPLDLLSIRSLRQIVRDFQPDLIHAWGPLAVKLTLAVPSLPFVASHMGDPDDLVARWRLRSAKRVLSSESLLAVSPSEKEARTPIRTILASGGFDHRAGLKYAVWAFDIIRQLQPEVSLVILGDGPLRLQVERFSQALGQTSSQTRFVGWQRDISKWLTPLTLVWLTHRQGGQTFAREAQSAGLATIGFHHAQIMVSVNNPVALATATHDYLAHNLTILPDPKSSQTPDAVAAKLATVYDSVYVA